MSPRGRNAPEVIRYNVGTEFAGFFDAELRRPGAPVLADLRSAPSVSEGYLRLLRTGGDKGRRPSRTTLMRLLEALGWSVDSDQPDESVIAVRDGRIIRFERDESEDRRTAAHRRPAGQSDRAAAALRDLSADLSDPMHNISQWLNSEHLGRAAFEAQGTTWTLSMRRQNRKNRFVKIERLGWGQSLRIPERKLSSPKLQWLGGWHEYIGDDGWQVLYDWTAPDRQRDGLAAFPPALHPVFTALGFPVSTTPQGTDPLLQADAVNILTRLVDGIPGDILAKAEQG